MGICQSKQIKQNTFNTDNWDYIKSPILPQCQILQNIKNRQQHTFLWKNKIKICFRQQQIYKKRQNQQNSYHHLQIYEIGRQDQYYFLITQQFIRLKQCKLSYTQAVVAAYQSLRAFQFLLKDYGGFIAKNDMIFITKQGTVKVWINQNPAKNQPSYPNPKLRQEQFIESIINQINSLVDTNTNATFVSTSNSGQTNANNNKIPKQKNFPSILKSLRKILTTYKVKRIKYPNKIFQNYIQQYKGYLNKSINHDFPYKKSHSAIQNIQDKPLRFIVGEQNKGKNYIRKYTLQKGENPFSKQKSQIDHRTQTKIFNNYNKFIQQKNILSDLEFSKSYGNSRHSRNQSFFSNFSKQGNKEIQDLPQILKGVTCVESKLVKVDDKRLNPNKEY